MEPIVPSCAGLDVHLKTVMACVRRITPDGGTQEEIRRFGTTTGEILELGDWMASQGVKQVAMESTGVYWKPIWNILEDRFELLLVNPRHIKRVPGRKTDVTDCQWIATLLQMGLLSPSFVPPRPQRELRDLTRHRTQLVSEQTRVINRVHKILEDANIKLGAVVSDITGVSARDMIDALIRGDLDPGSMANLARRRMRKKIPELEKALQGHLTDHHRFMLRTLWDHLGFLETTLAQLSSEIDRRIDEFPSDPEPSGEGEEHAEDSDSPMASHPTFPQAIELAIEIPGIEKRSAQNILAEIGIDMSRFPTSRHLRSWAKICPGNYESAGKRRSGKTGKGNRWLRATVVQSAWAASRTKNSYLAAQYRRLAGRRGSKRANVAVANSILDILYVLLKRNAHYRDLGPDYFDRRNADTTRRRLVRRLRELGYDVQLQLREEAA